jgi:hypothetical protein
VSELRYEREARPPIFIDYRELAQKTALYSSMNKTNDKLWTPTTFLYIVHYSGEMGHPFAFLK